jgi:hypothetical protein
LPGVSQELPIPDPTPILRNLNIVSSGRLTVVSPKREEDVCPSSVGAAQVSPGQSAQERFNDYSMNYFTDSAKSLVTATPNYDVPTCDCIGKCLCACVLSSWWKQVQIHFLWDFCPISVLTKTD